MARESEERIGSASWASYAAVAWCVVFGALHLYWAMGGTAGFAQFSTPPNKMRAFTHDPGYVRMAWGVVIVCAFGAIVALAPSQAWGRRVPRWSVLTILWIACGISLLRGVGNLIQAALELATAGGGHVQRAGVGSLAVELYAVVAVPNGRRSTGVLVRD